ncbi:MAG: hypothetical protein M3Y08_13895 [Fibrobacterota bacterium]|nr:hypothetical protein [Fibrobacterota bacterium]
MRMLPLLKSTILVSLLALPRLTSARDVIVPEPLRPWKAWVAEKLPNLPCPSAANSGQLCVTYASLRLDLGDRGGSFSQLVTVFGRQWVQLPGGEDGWPKDVKD